MALSTSTNNLLTGAVTTVFVLIMLGLFLFVGAQTLDLVRDSQGDTRSALTTNESLSSNTTLANAGTPTITDNVENTTEVVRNVSDSSGTTQTLTRNTHYNLTKDGTFTVLPAAAGLSSGWSLNITYNSTVFEETHSYNSTTDGLQGLDEFSTFQPTIAIVAVLVLVVGLILGGLGAFMASKMR